MYLIKVEVSTETGLVEIAFADGKVLLLDEAPEGRCLLSRLRFGSTALPSWCRRRIGSSSSVQLNRRRSTFIGIFLISRRSGQVAEEVLTASRPTRKSRVLPLRRRIALYRLRSRADESSPTGLGSRHGWRRPSTSFPSAHGVRPGVGSGRAPGLWCEIDHFRRLIKTFVISLAKSFRWIESLPRSSLSKLFSHISHIFVNIVNN
jgi:hypothetical protein